jgi:ComF family protein
MSDRMARLAWPRDVLDERAALIPVPLHGSRLRERGFNQSALLARELAARWRLPSVENALERTRATTTQTRLTPGERHRNVSGCFRVAPGAMESLRGAHVVLVDDVVTTGATLNACAEVLLEGGVRIVSYVTFGRAKA